MNSRLIVFMLMLPTIVCSMESENPLLTTHDAACAESAGSPRFVYSPSSSGHSSGGTPVTVTIDRSNSRESLSSQGQGTIPPSQKSLLTAYTIGAGLVLTFFTGFSVGRSSCEP